MPSDRNAWRRREVLRALGAVGLLGSAGGMLSPLRAAALKIGQPAPAATLITLDGEHLSTSQYSGKVIILTFWATWCVPCREEFPDLVKLEKAYRARGVAVLGVSIDLPKDMPKIEKFLAANQPDFPNYVKRAGGDDQDFIDAVDPKWGGELPFTVLYGRDGKKARVLSGMQSYAEFEKAVADLLK